MTPEEMAAMQKSITENVVAAVTAIIPKPPEPAAPPTPPEAPKGGSGENGGFTAQDVAQAVKEMISADKESDASKVYDTMWKENYNSMVGQTPGLDEFIKGEDDYGNVREDQLNKIESYEDRKAALVKLTSSFQEASAGGSGNRRPVVNKKVEQKKQDAQDEYQKLQDKQDSGEYTTKAEMTADFFKAFNKETEGLA